MKVAPFLILLYSIIGCQSTPSHPEVFPTNTGTTIKTYHKTFTSVSDLNDSYFTLNQDQTFEYYKLLLDSIKNTVYSGTYRVEHDTIFLEFKDEDGKHLLGERVLIDTLQENILFLDASPETKYMHLFN